MSYGNGNVGAGYSTYQEGDVDANRFNGVFLNVGSTWEEAAYNGFVLGNGVALPTIPILVIIDPTSDNAAVVIHNRALANTITKGKLPLCTADKDAGYAFVQVVDNGEAGKSYNGDFVLLVGDFTKIGGTSGSDIRTVIFNNLRATIRGISIYENCEDVRVVQSGVLWKNIVATDVIGANVPHLSYTVGTQYVAMLPDSYVDRNNADGEHVWSNALMDLKLKSIGVVPRQQMGFAELRPTNTFELYNFDKLSSDIESLSEIDEGELSSYDVLLKHKRPHPYAEDDSLYEGQAEADLQYISLSALLEGYVGDSQLPDLNLSSVVVRKDDGQNFIELHEFHEDNAKSVSDISGDGVDLLIRNPKGGGRELQYLSLSSLSAALSGSSTVDSETDLQLSSIQRNQDNGSLELFDFDDSDTEDFGQLSDSGNYDVVLRKYSGDRELPA